MYIVIYYSAVFVCYSTIEYSIAWYSIVYGSGSRRGRQLPGLRVARSENELVLTRTSLAYMFAASGRCHVDQPPTLNMVSVYMGVRQSARYVSVITASGYVSGYASGMCRARIGVRVTCSPFPWCRGILAHAHLTN